MAADPVNSPAASRMKLYHPAHRQFPILSFGRNRKNAYVIVKKKKTDIRATEERRVASNMMKVKMNHEVSCGWVNVRSLLSVFHQQVKQRT